MGLEKNNNSRIIYRVAKSNLLGKKLYSFISALTIMLAISFISALALFWAGTKTAESRALDSMQHVMFEKVSENTMQEMAEDPGVELLLPYKFLEEQESGGVKFSLYYMESGHDKIRAFELSKGKGPEKYNEIAVDKKFMKALGQDSHLGTEVHLKVAGETEKFTVTGYTENDFDLSIFPVYVSREYAKNSAIMKNIPFTALVRLLDAGDMTTAEFENKVYQMGADYGIDRVNININGKFEESLEKRNANLYGIILTSILILAAGAVVIYSIFYLSVSSRVRQIGQLQTIGMTQKQVKKMIRREGMILSGIAIPAGLIVGGAAAYLLQPDGWSFRNFLIAAVGAGIFGMLVVQLSVGKPAALAAKVSPIEAAGSYEGEEKEDGATRRRMLSPLTLAQLGVRRNRKKWWLTTISLAFGGILLLAGATYLASWDEDQYSRQERFKNAEYEIIYLYDAHNNPRPYGISDLQLGGHMGEELAGKLEEIPYVKTIEFKEGAYGNIEFQNGGFLAAFTPVTEKDAYFDGRAEGDVTYEYLAENDAVLVTNEQLMENLYGVTFQPGDLVTFHWFDGKEHKGELKIAGTVASEHSDDFEGAFLMADETMKKLWPDMNMTNSIRIAVEDYDKNGDMAEAEIKKVVNQYPDLTLSTLREQKIDDSAQLARLNIQIYGIAAFIIMFSILNLINTLISSIMTRGKELAMLESVGMEQKQIKQMLLWESIFNALPNIVISLIDGSAAGYGIVYWMKTIAGYMEYQFPTAAAVLYAAGMILIPVVVSGVCLKLQNKESLVARIGNIE